MSDKLSYVKYANYALIGAAYRRTSTRASEVGHQMVASFASFAGSTINDRFSTNASALRADPA